jgi:ubiquinone/menaquinone biosynthesis C-methylase UbiE
MPVLESMEGCIIEGFLKENEIFESLKFDVFIGGQAIEHRLLQASQDDRRFQIVLHTDINLSEAPSIQVRFFRTDQPVPINSNLKGFVNNPNEAIGEHLLANRMFYNIFAKAFPRTDVPQRLIDHVSGPGADLDLYRVLGIATVIDIMNFGVINAPSNKVVDFGCGCGRMGSVIASILDPSLGGVYTGFDIWEEGIAWAQNHVSRYYPHASFNVLGQHQGYDAKIAHRIPLPDASQDAAIATSLFTHLRAKPASTYAAEIARILKKGCKAYLTFFASKELYRSWNMPPQAEEDDYAIYIYHTEIQVENTFADEGHVIDMLKRNGLKLLGLKYGTWRQPKNQFRGLQGGQDVFILERV